MTFCDPHLTVPEAARLLRPGGLLAFNAESPLHFICWDAQTQSFGDRLRENYFDTKAVDDGDGVSFSLRYGEWLRLFRAHRFTVEDLIELRPSPDAQTTYERFTTLAWARNWPAEHIWRARKA